MERDRPRMESLILDSPSRVTSLQHLDHRHVYPANLTDEVI